MGDKGFDGRRVRFSDHMSHLKQAVEICRDKLRAEFDHLNILIHDPRVDEFGSIPDTVFSQINFAELGILDLSAESPSVMYELTLLHALGTPVIPVHMKHRVDQGKLPFYLRHDYCCIVDDFRVQTLADALLPNLRSAMNLEILAADRQNNPITKFYGMPLVDVSASTGLATGYFHNFISDVIKQKNSVFSRVDDLKKMVILLPSRFDEVGGMSDQLKVKLQKIGLEPEKVHKEDGTIYEDADHIRGPMILFKAGNYLWDVPAPLRAQISSPLFAKVSKLIAKSRGPNAAHAELLANRIQTQMIERFFAVLEELARTSVTSDPNRLAFMTIDQFTELLQSEMSGS